MSATALPPRITCCSARFAVLCATVLVFVHYPLPWDADDPLELPPIYMLGVWLSILLAIGFIGVYAWQITEEGRLIADALAATELVLAREQHLSQLDGLAAAAAHELGTPLSTISVIAKELERALEPDSPHADDVRLLREQAQRCRDILAKLTELLDRRAVRPHAALRADRGGGRAASQFRHRHRCGAASRCSAADGRAQSGDPLRARQSGGERGRFRARAASRSPPTGATRMSRSRSATTGRALRRRSWPGSASLMCDEQAPPHECRRRNQRPRPRLLHRQDAAGAVRRHASISKTAAFRTAARWSGCAGRAAISSGRSAFARHLRLHGHDYLELERSRSSLAMIDMRRTRSPRPSARC